MLLFQAIFPFGFKHLNNEKENQNFLPTSAHFLVLFLPLQNPRGKGAQNKVTLLVILKG